MPSVFRKVSRGPRLSQTGGITKPPLYLHALTLKKKKKGEEEARKGEQPSRGGGRGASRGGGLGALPRAGVPRTPTGIALRRGTPPPGRQLARGRAGVALAASPPQPCPVLARCWREPAGGGAAEAKMEWEEGKALPGELL